MSTRYRGLLPYCAALTIFVLGAGLLMRGVHFESGMTPETPSIEVGLARSGSNAEYQIPRDVCFPGSYSTKRARGDAYYEPTASNVPFTQGGKQPGNHYELTCLSRDLGNKLVLIWLALLFLPIGVAMGLRLSKLQD